MPFAQGNSYASHSSTWQTGNKSLRKNGKNWALNILKGISWLQSNIFYTATFFLLFLQEHFKACQCPIYAFSNLCLFVKNAMCTHHSKWQLCLHCPCYHEAGICPRTWSLLNLYVEGKGWRNKASVEPQNSNDFYWRYHEVHMVCLTLKIHVCAQEPCNVNVQHCTESVAFLNLLIYQHLLGIYWEIVLHVFHLFPRP